MAVLLKKKAINGRDKTEHTVYVRRQCVMILATKGVFQEVSRWLTQYPSIAKAINSPSDVNQRTCYFGPRCDPPITSGRCCLSGTISPLPACGKPKMLGKDLGRDFCSSAILVYEVLKPVHCN